MAQVLNQLATKSVVRTISPIDGGVYTERELDNLGDINAVLSAAEAAQKKWQDVPLATRTQYLEKALDALLSNKDAIAREITQQMGRPISQSAGELRGLEERARYMMDIAPSALADVVPEQKDGFKRFIKRVPLGVVAIVAPWNYPYLTSVNGIFPALLAPASISFPSSS